MPTSSCSRSTRTRRTTSFSEVAARSTSRRFRSTSPSCRRELRRHAIAQSFDQATLGAGGITEEEARLDHLELDEHRVPYEVDTRVEQVAVGGGEYPPGRRKLVGRRSRGGDDPAVLGLDADVALGWRLAHRMAEHAVEEDERQLARVHDVGDEGLRHEAGRDRLALLGAPETEGAARDGRLDDRVSPRDLPLPRRRDRANAVVLELAQ